MPNNYLIRPARTTDLNELLRLEALFSGDRISRRSFLHLLRRGHADLLIAENPNELIKDKKLIGDIVIFYRRNTLTARIYSLIIDPNQRNLGIGSTLLKISENTALQRGRNMMILEVREDNHAAMKFYQRLGYQMVKQIPKYYEDGAAAWRLTKNLAVGISLKST